jgi:hypothetical protein
LAIIGEGEGSGDGSLDDDKDIVMSSLDRDVDRFVLDNGVAFARLSKEKVLDDVKVCLPHDPGEGDEKAVSLSLSLTLSLSFASLLEGVERPAYELFPLDNLPVVDILVMLFDRPLKCAEDLVTAGDLRYKSDSFFPFSWSFNLSISDRFRTALSER